MSGRVAPRRALLALAAMAAVGPAMADTPYAEPGTVWVVETINGQPFAARATLGFPEAGRIAGQAPCNRYGGAQTASWPGFAATEVFATRMACPELAAEGAYLAALSAMRQARLGPDGALILSNETGGEMVFRPAP